MLLKISKSDLNISINTYICLKLLRKHWKLLLNGLFLLRLENEHHLMFRVILAKIIPV